MSISKGAASKAAVVALVILTIMTGCRSGTERSFVTTARRDRTIRVEVTNDNFLDATVFAMTGAASIRLGDVSGKTSKTLSLNPDRVSLASGLQLLVDLIGSQRAFLSNAVYVDPGGAVGLQIAPSLNQSYVVLR